MNNQPIGVLDSGVGGLTIWKQIIALLPQESTVYVADSKNCPYGVKTQDEIYPLARRLVTFLLEKESKLIVLACNTITVSALEKLRREFPKVPIIGTVPVIKTAAEKSKDKRIGIFSTPATAQSQYQRDLINRFARDCDVLGLGSDSLVDLIEKGGVDHPEIEQILRKELQLFQDARVDTLVLGCSHFPLIKRKIQKIMGPGVLILDSGPAIARHVRRILERNEAFSDTKRSQHKIFTSGAKGQVSDIVRKIGYNNAIIESIFI